MVQVKSCYLDYKRGPGLKLVSLTLLALGLGSLKQGIPALLDTPALASEVHLRTKSSYKLYSFCQMFRSIDGQNVFSRSVRRPRKRVFLAFLAFLAHISVYLAFC